VPDSCLICDLPDELGAINAGAHWTANIAQDATDRPWIVVQTKKHVESFSELSNDQRSELSEILSLFTKHLESLPTVRRVHIQLLNEIEPPHVHLHISTTHTGEEGSSGPASLSTPLADSVAGPARGDWMPAISKPATVDEEKSALVRGIVCCLEIVRRFGFFDKIYEVWSPRDKVGSRRLDGGESHVLVWTLVLMLAGVAAFIGHLEGYIWVSGIAFTIATYRLIDILTYQIAEFLDRRQNHKKSLERSLTLAFINLFQVFLWVVIADLAFASPDVVDTADATIQEYLWAAYATVTLRGESFDDINHLWIDVVATASGSFLLLVVISTILGVLSSRLTDETNRKA